MAFTCQSNVSLCSGLVNNHHHHHYCHRYSFQRPEALGEVTLRSVFCVFRGVQAQQASPHAAARNKSTEAEGPHEPPGSHQSGSP